MDSPSRRPVVYEYLSPQAFLQDYYTYRKSLAPGFSYEAWACELGLQSKSFLRLIVIGKKKPSPKFLLAFSDSAFDDKAEQKYFSYLTQYSMAATQSARDQILPKMLEVTRLRTSVKLISDCPSFTLNPLLPRLFSILSFKDIKATAETCAHILKVELADIVQALQTLRKLDLAHPAFEDGSEIWKAVSDVFHVPDSFGSVNLMDFHKQSLMDAMNAFHQPKELRKYQSMLLPMSAEDLQSFQKSLDQFMTEQLLKFNSPSLGGKRIFQVNLNFHAVTEPPLTERPTGRGPCREL